MRVVCNQDDPRLPSLLTDFSPFDLVVDDASHHGDLTGATYRLLWPLVAPGGWYVIEDWQVGFDDWPLFDSSMRDLAASLLAELRLPDGDVADITYRYGMVLVRKRSGVVHAPA